MQGDKIKGFKKMGDKMKVDKLKGDTLESSMYAQRCARHVFAIAWLKHASARWALSPRYPLWNRDFFFLRLFGVYGV